MTRRSKRALGVTIVLVAIALAPLVRRAWVRRQVDAAMSQLHVALSSRPGEVPEEEVQLPPWIIDRRLRPLGDAGVERLLEIARDSDLDSRSVAVYALERLQHPASVGPLVQMLRDERNLDLQTCMVTALGELRDRRAVPVILETFRNPEVGTRGRVIQWHAALGAITGGDPFAAIRAELARPVPLTVSGKPPPPKRPSPPTHEEIVKGWEDWLRANGFVQ